MNKPNLACGPNLNLLGNTIGHLHVRSALISLPYERHQKIAVRCGYYWRVIREVGKTLLNSRPVQELSPIMPHGGAEACASLSFHYLDHLCPACLQEVSTPYLLLPQRMIQVPSTIQSPPDPYGQCHPRLPCLFESTLVVRGSRPPHGSPGQSSDGIGITFPGGCFIQHQPCRNNHQETI